MPNILFKEEVFTIIGCRMEVWKNLGYGFSEVIYKDAMEIEFLKNEFPCIREQQLSVKYKGITLSHTFKSDFTLFDSIIIEVKSGEDGVISNTIQQTLNYMKVSGCRLGLIINFGKTKMDFKRLVL